MEPEEKSWRNSKYLPLYAFALTVFVVGTIFLITDLVNKPNFVNPPCFYYISDYEIKLFGLNETTNHSIFVTQIPDSYPIVYDNSTTPSTNIPLCQKYNKTKVVK